MSNGRIDREESPAGRIAAVARSLCLHFEAERRRTGVGPSEPDYADFRDVLRPFIERELILARIDEARKTGGIALTARIKELAADLVNLRLPPGFEDL